MFLSLLWRSSSLDSLELEILANCLTTSLHCFFIFSCCLPGNIVCVEFRLVAQLSSSAQCVSLWKAPSIVPGSGNVNGYQRIRLGCVHEMCFVIRANCSSSIMKDLYPSKCLFSEYHAHFAVLVVWNSGHISSLPCHGLHFWMSTVRKKGILVPSLLFDSWSLD